MYICFLNEVWGGRLGWQAGRQAGENYTEEFVSYLNSIEMEVVIEIELTFFGAKEVQKFH